MPAKKQVKKEPVKKAVNKKTVKADSLDTARDKEKKVKTVAKKPTVVAKEVTSTVRTKKTESEFSLMNIVAIVVVLAIIVFVAFLASTKSSNQVVTPSKTVKTVNYDCNADQNALTILKDTNKVETQDSSYGVFVDSINGQANTNDSFWIFYTNGQMATVAPDQYTCKDGDKIEWRFEKIL